MSWFFDRRRQGRDEDVSTLKERAERQLWRSWKQVHHRLAPVRPRQYVFVSGVQRSGTNMLMDTLEWSSRTDVYHETDSRAYDQYEMRPFRIIHDVANRSRAPLLVLKTLCEFDLIPDLMEEFAPAKTLWIVRQFDDCVNSAVRSFGNFGQQLHRMSKNKNSDGWRGRGMSDETQALLSSFDHPEINEASAAALMWYYRNVLFFERELDRLTNVRVISYERLVSEPILSFNEILSFLDLPGNSHWLTRYMHSGSVGKSPKAKIEPQIRSVCEGLATRFTQMLWSTRNMT